MRTHRGSSHSFSGKRKRKVHWWADRNTWPLFKNMPASGAFLATMKSLTGVGDATYAVIFDIMQFAEAGTTQPIATLAQAGGTGAVCKRVVGEYLWQALAPTLGSNQAFNGGSVKAGIVVSRESGGGVTIPDLFDAGDEAERLIISQRVTQIFLAGAGTIAQPYVYDASEKRWDVTPSRRLEMGEGIVFTVQWSPPPGTGAALLPVLACSLWMRALFGHST